MMNGDNNNLHILHRAQTCESSAERSDNPSYEAPQQAPEAERVIAQPGYVPVSPLLPRGLEYEISGNDAAFQLTPPAIPLDGEVKDDQAASREESWLSRQDFKLLVSFVVLVVSGAGNVVSTKLQADSMYNYGIFLSLFSYIVYVPLCFAFIIPVAKYGWFDHAITTDDLALPKKSFAIMGFLDCLSAVVQTFASIYLPGPLLVLLPQAAIPLSMLLSKYMLGEKFRSPQYVGAVIVFLGLLIVLEPILTYRRAPEFLCEAVDLLNHCTICSDAKTREECAQINHDYNDSNNNITSSGSTTIFDVNSFTRIMLQDKKSSSVSSVLQPFEDGICQWVPLGEAATSNDFSVVIWSVVMVLSCVPMTLSSIYKQVKLSCHGDLHPVFLFGWIGAFQFLFSTILAPVVGLVDGLPPSELPPNLLKGFMCYFGAASIDKGCHPDSRCSSGHAFLYVNLCLVCHGIYLLCMLCVLKYGSSSLLFLAMTMMVPLGNLAFSLPFMEHPEKMHVSDIAALIIIVLGLLLYRFGHAIPKRRRRRTNLDGSEGLGDDDDDDDDDEPTVGHCHPLLEPLLAYADV